jgi:cytochrome c-type biogenesis protein CcmH
MFAMLANRIMCRPTGGQREAVYASRRDPIFWARTLQTALLCVIIIAMLGAGQSRFDRLGHELMCSCGCGQILLECNHVGCPDSARMIEELKAQLATANTDTQVQQWFAAKYGATVLASPMRGGFDNAAWIVPFAVFALATLGTFAVVWLWKRRALSLVQQTPACGGVIGAPSGLQPDPIDSVDPQTAALRERIRRETEY